MQSRHMARYANPTSDLPKNMADLMTKISMNQGFFSYFRGQSALIVLLTATHSFKFFCYDSVLRTVNSMNPTEADQERGSLGNQIIASSVSAMGLSLLLFPIDLCHTRMSCDMSKK